MLATCIYINALYIILMTEYVASYAWFQSISCALKTKQNKTLSLPTWYLAQNNIMEQTI